jgi:hypothetical protein
VAHGSAAPAAGAEAFNWRAVLVGALAALVAFAAIMYA